jgi:hypothetical protein
MMTSVSKEDLDDIAGGGHGDAESAQDVECDLASGAWGFLQGAWTFDVVEVLWSGVALR